MEGNNMRAALIDKIGSIRLIDMEEPKIVGNHEVKVRVKFSGICGSELHAFHGTHPFRKPPLVSGHEFSGTVVMTGKNVTRVKPGDRVTAEPQVACGLCWSCRHDMYHMCEHKKVLGAMGWTGSFAEYIILPEETLIKLPDEVSFEHGALFEPLAVGTHAVRISDCGEGDRALVIGCGPIGLSIVMAAKLAGCREIYVSDAVDFNLGIAREMGATHSINVNRENLRQWIADLTEGIGVDYTFLAFGNGPIVTDAIEVTRKAGTIMEVAVLGSPKEVDFKNFYQKEIRMHGSNVYTSEDYELVMQAVTSGRFNLDHYITHVFPIEEAPRAFELMDKKHENFVKVLLRF
jgi:2-desacetyl-2-hydroxyethyl bacteriochlorophyllide A dehydrogenase